jgi:hypothetical protein
MFWKLFKKKSEIPDTWVFRKDTDAPIIDSFVNQVREQLFQSFPDGVYEYEDGFVEFYVQRGEALFRFRFEIRKWTPQAISIESVGFWLAFDRLETKDGEIPGYEDRYYRISFKIDEIIQYTALDSFNFHSWETRSEKDFSPLFNEIGWLWRNGCVKIMDQINSIETVLQFCEQMKSEKKRFGISDNGILAYLHCQCLMILKKDWQPVFISYQKEMSEKMYEHLREGLDRLTQRYQC